MTTALRPLTLGELLDRTFQLYRQHFLVVAGIVALPHLAVLAVQLSQAIASPPNLRGDPSNALAHLGATLLWLLLAVLVTIIVSAIAQGAMVFAVSELHLGRPVAIGRAFGGISGIAVSLVLITVALALLVGVGLIFCVVPGVLLALRWAFVVQTVVLERADIGQAMSRSAELTAGNRGRLFVIYLLFFVLSLVFTSIWQVPTAIALIAAGAHNTEPPTWALILPPIGAFLTQAVVGPLLHIAITLSYYDARVKKEGFDLEHMMGQMDAPPAGAPA